MPAFGVLSTFMNFGANMAGLAGKAWENIETNRRFELQAAQVLGQTKANQAASGIETIGGASPGAQKFLETMDSEFKNQLAMMKRGQQIGQIGGLVGAGLTAGGGMAENAFKMADLYKTGSSYTPGAGGPAWKE